jgi:hypothetical protein
VFTTDFPSPTLPETTPQVNDTAAATPIVGTASPDILQSFSSKRGKRIRKPSAGPPPAYTAQREDVIPARRSGPGVCVTAEGSPRVYKAEYVQVGVDIRWPDKSSEHGVRRGTTEDELKNITPVKDLLEFGQDADVMVSPPESAKSGTKVHVDSSYQELIERVKTDLEEALDVKFKKQVEATAAKLTKQEEANGEKLRHKLRKNSQYIKNLATHLCIRQIQDSVYYTMSSRLGKRDYKGWASFEALVNEYEAKKTIEILLPSDIENLKTAKDRTIANKFAHPDVNDEVTTELLWKVLDEGLEEAGEEEMRQEYRRYYDFVKKYLF